MNTRKSTHALAILAAFCASTTLASAAGEMVYQPNIQAQTVVYEPPDANDDGAAIKDAVNFARVPAVAPVAENPARPATQPTAARLADESFTDRFIALGVVAALLAFSFLGKGATLRHRAIKEAEPGGRLPSAESAATQEPAELEPPAQVPASALETATAQPVAQGLIAEDNPIGVSAIHGNTVVPVDFSPNSALAIRLALVWTKPNDWLRIVYAVDLDNAFPSANLTPSDFIALHPAFAEIDSETAYHWSQLPWVVVLPKAIEIVERWAFNEFAKLRQTLVLTNTENLEFQVLHGDPVKQIVSFSEEIAANLIVLVAHQHSTTERLISGSHADQLLHASRIPVIVACEPIQAEICLPQEILITTDYSPESLPVFLTLMELLQDRKPTITVLTVEESHEHRRESPAKLEGLEQAMLALGMTVSNVKIQATNAEQGILDYLKIQQPQLVAMSSHGRMGFAELIHPSVTKAILHGSGIPLLVVHQRSMPTAKTPASLSDLLRIVTG